MAEEDASTTLRLIAEARKEEALMKTTLRARLWEQYEKELLLMRYRISRLANQAADEGHSLSRIGRAYGTSNWKTIRDLIALTATEKDAEAAMKAEQIKAREEALANPFSYDPATMVLTLRAWTDSDGVDHVGPEKRYQAELAPDGVNVLLAYATDLDPRTLGNIQTKITEIQYFYNTNTPTPVAARFDSYGDPSTWGVAEDEDDDE